MSTWKRMTGWMVAALAIAVCVAMVAGCGSVKKAGKWTAGKTAGLMTKGVKMDVGADVKHRPYMARAFDADKQTLMAAMEKSVKGAGYAIHNSELPGKVIMGVVGVLRTVPTNVEQVGDRVWRMEGLEVHIYENVVVEGKNVVSCAYLKGLSSSPNSFFPVQKGTMDTKPDYKIDKDRKYYKDIMENIAKEVGE